MTSYRIAVVVLCCTFVSETVVARRQKCRMMKDTKSTDVDENIEKLTGVIDQIQADISKMKVSAAGGSTCRGNSVHLYVHGDYDHVHSDGDQHVHIDLQVDDVDDDNDHNSEANHVHNYHAAHCHMIGATVTGSIHIVQQDDERSANFLFDIENLGDVNTGHMVHVHEFGHVSGGCTKLGGHYSPYNSSVDLSDLGIVVTDSDGAIADTWVNETMVTLFSKHSIVGRGIIIHNTEGSPVACCTIGLSSDNAEDGYKHHSGYNHSMVIP